MITMDHDEYIPFRQHVELYPHQPSAEDLDVVVTTLKLALMREWLERAVFTPLTVGDIQSHVQAVHPAICYRERIYSKD
jgi:hypothetical protein